MSQIKRSIAGTVLAKSVPISEVSRWLGHKSTSMAAWFRKPAAGLVTR